VGIGAGGLHIANESWELDGGCDQVLWCGILGQGVDPRGVDLGSMSIPEVLISLLNSAFLVCCYAALLKPSTARVGIYPA
jgi:hypothetical protein